MQFREREGTAKPIPQFINQRNKLYDQYCPKVDMEFGFQNKEDDSIKIVKGSSAPMKSIQRDPMYIKLYEIASIKVNTYLSKISIKTNKYMLKDKGTITLCIF